jgi:hypothetical protein
LPLLAVFFKSSSKFESQYTHASFWSSIAHLLQFSSSIFSGS